MWKLGYLKVKFILLTPKRILKEYKAFRPVERGKKGLIKKINLKESKKEEKSAKASGNL